MKAPRQRVRNLENENLLRAIDNIFIGSSNTNRGSATQIARGRLPIVLDQAGAKPIAVAVVATSVTGTSDSRGRIKWDELR